MDSKILKIVIGMVVIFTPLKLFASENGYKTPVMAPKEYLVMKNKFNGNDKGTLERGEYIYSKKCSQCHGEKGDATGSIFPEGVPIPILNKDFFKNMPDGQLFWAIENGIGDSLMPAFGPGSDVNLSSDDVWKVLTFIRERFGK